MAGQILWGDVVPFDNIKAHAARPVLKIVHHTFWPCTGNLKTKLAALKWAQIARNMEFSEIEPWSESLSYIFLFNSLKRVLKWI